MPILILIFLASLNAQEDCPKLDSYYIVGNYKACSTYPKQELSQRCRYVRTLCSMAVSDHDMARYEFSVLGAEFKKAQGMSDINGLALLSMSEALFLSGEYAKARSLSSELNALISKKMPYSYPYFVSELLLSRSYLSSFDNNSAQKRLALAKAAGMEEALCASLE